MRAWTYVGMMKCQYILDLLPLHPGSFTPTPEPSTKSRRHNVNNDDEDEDDQPILNTTVDITTFHEHGPVPVAFTMPVAEDKTNFGSGKEEKGLEYMPVFTGGYSTVQFPPVVVQ